MLLRTGKTYFSNIDTKIRHEPGSIKVKIVATNNGTDLPITAKQVSDDPWTNGTRWYLTKGGKAMGHSRNAIFKLEGEVQ